MSSFTCCIWWWLFGILLGWLLSWWLSKLFGNGGNGDNTYDEGYQARQRLKEDNFELRSNTTSENNTNPTVADNTSIDSSRTRQDIMDNSVERSATISPATYSTPTISRADMLSAAGAAGFSFSGKKSDLEIIEGIGPKIAELLNDHGIQTFEQLSQSSIATINSILEKGGDRFKLAVPDTWPEQAALAAKNNWVALKALQESLDGGVKKS